MKRAMLVAQREYLENVRTKGFWFGILVMPFMLLLIALIPLVVESTREAKQFAVIDNSGWLLDIVDRKIQAEDFAIFLNTQRQADSETSEQIADDTLPRDYHEFNDLLATLSPGQVDALAFRILATQSYSGNFEEVDLPEEAADLISRYAWSMADWWYQLSSEEKIDISTSMSVNHFVRISESYAPKELNRMISEGDLFAYFVIGPDPIKSSDGSRYVSNNLTDRDLVNWFGGHVSRHIRQERLRQENLDSSVATWINQPLTFEGQQISRSGESEQVETQDIVHQWAPVVFVYLLWLSVLINTQMLLTNTIEEKSNKLIEVLLSSISPLELMAGKIVGIAATGLTIIGSWVLMIISFLVLLPMLLDISLPFDPSQIARDPWFLSSFVMYFILGYLLYAALLVGLGSVCNNLKEAQNLMLPVQLVQMIPILVMVPIGRDPNGMLAQILSYFPPLTPFVMMNRAAAPPTTAEYLITTLLLVVSIIIALWAAAKIFRIGILLTGKPPSLLEILRWFRAPVTGAKSQLSIASSPEPTHET